MFGILAVSDCCSSMNHHYWGNFKRDNGNVHRAAAKIIVSKSRAARGSVCNVLLSRDYSVDVGVILAMASCPCKRRKQCLDILLSDWICTLDVPDRERGTCIEAILRQPFCGIHSRWPVTEIVVKADRGRQRVGGCLLYTSPSPRDGLLSRMPSSA